MLLTIESVFSGLVAMGGGGGSSSSSSEGVVVGVVDGSTRGYKGLKK